MIFEEKNTNMEWMFSGKADVGDYVVIPYWEMACSELMFNGEKVEIPFRNIQETKLYCIKNEGGKCELMFDNALFPMAIAPFKTDKEICFKNSLLRKYLKKCFVPAFKHAMKLPDDLKIKCDLLTSSEVFGDNCLDWFKEPKHRIAMYKETSEWWWLGDEYGDCEGDASSAYFCLVSGIGSASYSYASNTNDYVRPRFVIGAKA